MNTKIIVAISVVLLVAFVLISYKATNQPEQTSYPDITKLQKTDHTQGTGKHILVEYADLQCPACKQFHDFFKSEQLKDANFAKVMSAKYTVVFRLFPLTSIHKNAQLAAQAAEAAGMQGKFFEFADAAFTNQEKWAESDTPMDQFVAFAKDLGLDQDKFKKDIDSDAAKKAVDADVQSGTKGDLNSTPSFYIDGEKITDFGSFDEFKKILVEKSK